MAGHCDTWLGTRFGAVLTNPLIQRADMNAKVRRDLDKGDTRVRIERNPHHIFAKLPRETRGDNKHPSRPVKLAKSDVT